MISYLNWRSQHLREEPGVLVGADLTQEWILPWWWEKYRQKNTLPVAFVDFGLSFQMKDWCRERGELVPLRVFDFAATKEEMEAALVEKFESDYGANFWDCRNTWFKKPLALLQSPFSTSLWIDLDCEIRCRVEPLFRYPGLAIAKDQIALNSPYPIYNSGVLLFRRGEKMVEVWAEASLKKSDLFRGDQELLSWLLDQEKFQTTELPAVYNWSRSLGENPDALIYHWHGVNGKKVIRYELNRWSSI